MARAKRTVEKVDAEHEAVAAIEARHRDRVAVLGAELADLESAMGGMVLDAELAGAPDAAAELSARLAALVAERGVSERAAAAARDRLRDLQRERWALEAVELRRQATELRAEAAQHSVRTLELQTLLEAHEDCKYEPAQPARQPSVVGSDIGGGGGFVNVVHVPTPRSQRMRIEADRLDAQAAELEQRELPTSGGVDGESLDGLLEKVHAFGVALLPSDGEIRRWVAEQERSHAPAAAQSRGALHFVLAWTDGSIDGRSRTKLIPEYEVENRATRAEQMLIDAN